MNLSLQQRETTVESISAQHYFPLLRLVLRLFCCAHQTRNHQENRDTLHSLILNDTPLQAFHFLSQRLQAACQQEIWQLIIGTEKIKPPFPFSRAAQILSCGSSNSGKGETMLTLTQLQRRNHGAVILALPSRVYRNSFLFAIHGWL